MRRYPGESSGGGGSVDEKPWGRLQDHIDLAAEVYARLPIGDFFRLRLVCKEWDRLASDQDFLEQATSRAIPSPYYIMGGPKSHRKRILIAGSWLLYYERWAGRWSWTRLPPWDCQVGGLLYDGLTRKFFNIHTRIFHSSPSAPEYGCLFDVAVRIAQGLNTVKVIFDDALFDTRMNSFERGWSTRYSDFTFAMADRVLYARQVQYTSQWPITYFRIFEMVDGKLDIGALSLETKLVTEPMVIYDIGAWQSRLFLFGLKNLEHGRFTITAWQLRSKVLPGTAPGWEIFDQMPDDVCAWLLVDEYIKNKFGDNGAVQMQTRFAGEHVLVFVTLGFLYVMEQGVLYNLELKTWEKVQVPCPRCHDLPLEQMLKGACDFANQDSLDVSNQVQEN